jgi:hypothetical protein
MQHRIRRTAVLAVALPIVASVCVADDSLTPKVPPTLDAALADVANPALDWASAWFSGANIVALPADPKRCPFNPNSRYFVCAPLSGGGLTLHQRFTLHDAGGATQTTFDPATTTSLHLENGVAGNWHGQLMVDGQQVLDLTGLGTPRHTLNGTSLTLMTPRSTDPQIPAERKTTITDLVLPVVVSGAPPGWPLSGTIDTRGRAISVSGDTTVFIATMRFDGSSLVTLTVTVPGGIQTCRVNITTIAEIGCRGSGDAPIGLEGQYRAPGPAFR